MLDELTPHQQGHEATGPIVIWLPMQAVAAIAELAIPHFTTRTIFSVANLGSEANFYTNVKILAVGPALLPCWMLLQLSEILINALEYTAFAAISTEIIMMGNCGACNCCRCSLSATGSLPGCGDF